MNTPAGRRPGINRAERGRSRQPVASNTAWSGWWLHEAMRDAGFPDGVVNYLSDPALIALKNGVLQSQSYHVDFDDWNVSGDVTVSWKPAQDILLYATYAKSFKSGGVNLSGIPNHADGTPATELATVKP